MRVSFPDSRVQTASVVLGVVVALMIGYCRKFSFWESAFQNVAWCLRDGGCACVAKARWRFRFSSFCLYPHCFAGRCWLFCASVVLMLVSDSLPTIWLTGFISSDFDPLPSLSLLCCFFMLLHDFSLRVDSWSWRARARHLPTTLLLSRFGLVLVLVSFSLGSPWGLALFQFCFLFLAVACSSDRCRLCWPLTHVVLLRVFNDLLSVLWLIWSFSVAVFNQLWFDVRVSRRTSLTTSDSRFSIFLRGYAQLYSAYTSVIRIMTFYRSFDTRLTLNLRFCFSLLCSSCLEFPF